MSSLYIATSVRSMRIEAPCIARLESAWLSSSTSLWRCCRSSCSSSLSCKTARSSLICRLSSSVKSRHSLSTNLPSSSNFANDAAFDSNRVARVEVLYTGATSVKSCSRHPRPPDAVIATNERSHCSVSSILFVRKLALRCFCAVFKARDLFDSRRELISESGSRTTTLSVSSGGRSCRDM